MSGHKCLCVHTLTIGLSLISFFFVDRIAALVALKARGSSAVCQRGLLNLQHLRKRVGKNPCRLKIHWCEARLSGHQSAQNFPAETILFRLLWFRKLFPLTPQPWNQNILFSYIFLLHLNWSYSCFGRENALGCLLHDNLYLTVFHFLWSASDALLHVLSLKLQLWYQLLSAAGNVVSVCFGKNPFNVGFEI